ncbi:hypothetical protein MCERE19_01470 [Spirosomataceae bacterium]|jgi:hypothetical protein
MIERLTAKMEKIVQANEVNLTILDFRNPIIE